MTVSTVTRRSVRDDRGSNLIEFALVFPLLLLITAGIIDVGLLIKDYQVVTNAAREGARYAALLPELDEEAVQGRVAAYLTAAGLNGADAATAADPIPVAIGGGTDLPGISVVVSYPRDYLMLAPVVAALGHLLSPTVTLQAGATMRQEVVTAQ